MLLRLDVIILKLLLHIINYETHGLIIKLEMKLLIHCYLLLLGMIMKKLAFGRLCGGSTTMMISTTL
ncbi:hypothetical protein U876_05835 [Aeromonas hydrophila NJ-35]|nr:hypothetical protein V428_17405 [Aeromonas hydrophila subsp. hydrophila AL09-71]AHX70562.1 hypothetical protein V429_17440 [Aeromonas hydrophila pc104A]AJE38581.1 hypothetical protein V469_05855 [Aeromonas hydrophila J-1]AKJ36996.1 hypothetical protein U876_05835 [Aeromonas hydrophila NJ-35]ALQ62471.1 hypothetical protein AS145_06065 [Aeromonas hydrophila]